MALRKIKYTQTNTGTWAADSAGIQTDIDRIGIITRIDVTTEVTPSATLAAANQPDGPFRLIQNLRIEGASETYINLPADDACEGGVLLHYLNRIDGFGEGTQHLVIVAPSRTYNPFTWFLHFGSRPKDWGNRDNPFDLTAFIPAISEGALRAIWVTSGNDVADDTVTISSAVMRFTLSTVQGSAAEIRGEMARQGVTAPNGMVPAWSTEAFAHTATSSDYATERDIPLGAWLRRIAIVCQDATGTRSLRAQDEVTGIGVKLAYSNEYLVKQFVDSLSNNMPKASFTEADDALTAGGSITAPRGIFVVDLRPHVLSNPDYGLDLTNYATGALKLGLTITTYAAGDDSLIIYDRVKPNTKALAGA